jgi:hypothetical protein
LQRKEKQSIKDGEKRILDDFIHWVLAVYKDFTKE